MATLAALSNPERKPVIFVFFDLFESSRKEEALGKALGKESQSGSGLGEGRKRLLFLLVKGPVAGNHVGKEGENVAVHKVVVHQTDEEILAMTFLKGRGQHE